MPLNLFFNQSHTIAESSVNSLLTNETCFTDTSAYTNMLILMRVYSDQPGPTRFHCFEHMGPVT